MVRFAVLQCGWPSPSVVERFGSYGEQLTRLLRLAPQEQWRVYDVEGGRDMPSNAELATYDGIVLSGSRHAVYDDSAWILDLRRLVVHAHSRRQRLLGICFGAQLLAVSLGGRVEPAAVGWEMGARSVTVHRETLQHLSYGAGVPDTFRVCQLHSDQVVELPGGAALVASSPRCPHEIFALGDTVCAVQGHPEFAVEACANLVQTRVDAGVVAPDLGRDALESLNVQPPPDPADPANPLRRFCQTFLRGDRELHTA